MPATAQSTDSTNRVYLEGGRSVGGSQTTQSVTVGMLVPSTLFTSLTREGEPFALHWDIWVSQWRAVRASGDRREFSQLGAMGVWRYMPEGAGSAWFVDLGFGGGLFNRIYTTRDHSFSTAFQFTEALGLGYRFGENKAYEVSVRLQHFSNGGIKEPNPGENLVRIRFSMPF